MEFNSQILRNKLGDRDKVDLCYTAAAAHLLHLVSGVEKSLISSTRIKSRTVFWYVPFYNALKGGGAITLGSSRSTSITFTENFFSDEKRLYKSKAYKNNLHAWLRLSAHEVRHLEHAKRFKYLIFYLIIFAYQYLRYGHDAAPLEIEANEGSSRFTRFIRFTRYELGVDFLDMVFTENLEDDKKIEIINFYWEKYINS